ncbi:hypothetical protein [Mesorhizobium sp. WSM3224]|uniref:hypothetical protein n=1 Tax=Mesorhizobium sp. WSM3224 TaxID=1040986 RepID=UPI00041388E2|nr:hypothetical protein [Mesorhizobium sp. WSM3224]
MSASSNVVLLAKYRAKLSRSMPAHPADDLSFMRPRRPKGGTEVVWWFVEGTGSYSADCAKGHQLAEEYLAYCAEHRTNGNIPLLGWIVNDMLVRCKEAGKLSGIEIGFLTSVNHSAMIGEAVNAHLEKQGRERL